MTEAEVIEKMKRLLSKEHSDETFKNIERHSGNASLGYASIVGRMRGLLQIFYDQGRRKNSIGK